MKTNAFVRAMAILATGPAMAGPVDDLAPGEWYEFPASELLGVLPSPLPEGDPRDIIDAYSGGTFDTQRNRLLVWGGGHAGYAGNEVYAFDVAAGRWNRLSNPSSAPLAVHTYDHLEYLPTQDALFGPGGSQWGSGSAVADTWIFDLPSASWRNAGRMPTTAYEFFYFNMTSDYDPLSGRVVVIGNARSGSFDPATNSWTLSGTGHDYALGMSGALDTQRRRFVEVGRGRAYVYPVASNGNPGTRETLTTSGPQAIVGCDGPGLVYDPASDRLVGWCGGAAIYSLNLDTRVWTQHAATNSVNPGDPYARTRPYMGTFGRFQYMPALNAFIVVHSIDANVYAYRLTSGTGTAPVAPTVSLTASPLTVVAGGSSTLSWSTQNVTSCSATGGWSGTRATSGSQVLSNLTATTGFGLSCTGSAGSASNSLTVTVSAPSGGDTGGGGTTDGGGTSGGSTGGGTTGGSSTDANADFQARATAPGVVRALGFDTQAEWLNHVFDNSGCRPEYAPGCRSNAWDQVTRASGAGAVRFDILSSSSANGAGQLAVNFSEDYATQFGSNESFYIQWRQRFDRYLIEHNYLERSGNGGEWKQVIIGQGDRRRADGSRLIANSCTEGELTMANLWGRRYPQTYMECGAYNPLQTTVPGGGWTSQNQRRDSSGAYTCARGGTGTNTTGCAYYAPDEWMTFMVHVELGPDGRAISSASGREQPGSIDSTIEFYVARAGQPFQLAHRQTGLVIPRGQHWDPATGSDPDNIYDPGYNGSWDARDGHPQAKYGKIWLLPYHTDKSADEVHEPASMWYDELIVSRNLIAAPGVAGGSGGGTSPPPPSPTLSLTASPTSIASGASSTLTWSGTNLTSCTASGGWSGSRSTAGSASISPTATTTYTLTCDGLSRSTTVTVTAPSGGGTGGGSTTTYTLLFDPDDHANGQPLNAATVSGNAWVYLTPENGVARVEFLVDGRQWHSEISAPFDIQGSAPFDFDDLAAGPHTVSAIVTESDGETATAVATFTVAGASSGVNNPPDTPGLAEVGGNVTSAESTLAGASAFVDPDGDAFGGSEWEISSTASFSALLLRRIIPRQTTLRLAAGILDAGSQYFVRTRHLDARGAASDWSNVVAITTAAILSGDADRDGTEDASTAPASSDSNANGIPDREEGICNLQTTSGQLVGVHTSKGNVRCLRAADASEAPGSIATGTTIPFGLFSFRVEGLRVDPVDPATVMMRFHLPARPPGSNKWYKYDPARNVLFELSGRVTFEGLTALVEFEDGGPGDFDGVVNGVIVDPSGLLTVAASGGGINDPGDVGSPRNSGSSLGSLLLVLLVPFLRRRNGLNC